MFCSVFFVVAAVWRLSCCQSFCLLVLAKKKYKKMKMKSFGRIENQDLEQTQVDEKWKMFRKDFEEFWDLNQVHREKPTVQFVSWTN